MMFKRGKCAETSWRKLRGFAQLADVIEGLDFINSVKPATPDRAAAGQASNTRFDNRFPCIIRPFRDFY